MKIHMRGPGRSVLVFLLAMVLLSARAEAQAPRLPFLTRPAQDSTARDHPFPRLLLPATIGAAVGSFAGALAGSALDWGGGDDPGLTGALVFGVAGGGAGSVLFAGPLLHQPVDLRHGLLATVAGGLAGGLTAALLGNATDSGTAAYFGYCLGQGAVTAGIIGASR